MVIIYRVSSMSPRQSARIEDKEGIYNTETETETETEYDGYLHGCRTDKADINSFFPNAQGVLCVETIKVKSFLI
jgi:hypothetical protein